MGFQATLIGVNTERVPPYGDCMRPVGSLGESSGRKIVGINGNEISIKGNFSGLYLPGGSIPEDSISDILLQHRNFSTKDTPPLLIVTFEEKRVEDAFIHDLMRTLRVIGHIRRETSWGALVGYLKSAHRQDGWTFECLSFDGFPEINGENALEDLLILMENNSRNAPVQNQILSLQKRLKVIQTLLAMQE